MQLLKKYIQKRYFHFLDSKSGPGFAMVDMGILAMLRILTELGETSAKSMFSEEAVKKLLNDKNEKFDLVIIEHFMNDMLIG